MSVLRIVAQKHWSNWRNNNHTRYDIVVMVQGDEPMTHPDMIDEAVQPLIDDHNIQVVNLLGRIKDTAEFEDRNCIKVVCDLNLNAMYFSREPIPMFEDRRYPHGKAGLYHTVPA
jgi:CMP-2-keto-3-deoxyoctulosonic acid synthetase